MRLTHLDLVNIRAISRAELRFQPGFNLIVGVNGVGKTTVLEALAICLSAVLKQSNKLTGKVASFTADDIRRNSPALDLECGVEISDEPFKYFIHQPLETYSPQKGKMGVPREQVHLTPRRAGFFGPTPPASSGKEPGGRPFAALFSTRRALPSERAPARGAAAGGVKAAYSEVFTNRELRLGEVASWMRVQRLLDREAPTARANLAALDEAVSTFLPGYSHLRPEEGERPALLIDHNGTTLRVGQLSDGERGALALVLDLTRRLAQANPGMAAPATQAEGVVLIDEIDLHLHPQWQRRIIRDLSKTFPRCQFIVTTHSPQVIGEVPHDRIQILTNENVCIPSHSFGLDSSRVLQEIMNAPQRTETVAAAIERVAVLIDNGDLAEARRLLGGLGDEIGEDDPEITRPRTLIDFMSD
jgi:predicted ATP-binding protein involved in virulence